MSVGGIISLGRRRAAAQWRQPVYRAGWLLAGGSVVTAAAGMAFWLFAARLYAPAVVGANSSVISAMMFLAGVAQLNLMSAVLRFVPTAGAGACRLIARFYGVSMGMSALAATVFLLGLRTWAPGLVPFLSSWTDALSFLLATTAWTLFVLHASTLVAVGRAGAATITNQCFNLAKLVLLLGFAVVLPTTGIWFSWTVAMGAAVAGALWFFAARAYPSFARARQDFPAEVPSLRELVRYVGPDYGAAIAWIAATTLVPILVLNLTDPAHAGVFALVWSMCFVLFSIPASFGQSLVAHGTLELDRLEERHRKVLAYSLAMVGLPVAVLVAFAPLILRLFGPWYVEQGTTTLRLLALSALPNCVVALTVSRARVHRRMAVVVGTMVALSGIVLGVTRVAVPVLGIDGGGLAWLLGEVVVAAAIGLGRLPSMLVRSPWPAVPADVRRRALQKVTALGWRPEGTLRSVSDTAVVFLGSPTSSAVLKVVATGSARALAREQEVLERLADDHRLGAWRRMVPTVLDAWHDGHGACLLLSRLPGAAPGAGVARPSGWLTGAAYAAVAPLHRLGSSPVVVDEPLLQRWVDEPVARVARVLPRRQTYGTLLEDLRQMLRRQLGGRVATMGWSHGDFHPGNVTLDGDAGVCGIVDWGGARPDSLPDIDLAHWLLTTAAVDGHRELGREVADRLGRRECWSPPEAALLQSGASSHDLPPRALLLLAWLSHVRMNLDKSDRYAASPVWLRRNVLPVLRAFGGSRGGP